MEWSTQLLLALLTGLLSYWAYHRYRYITYWHRHRVPGPAASFFTTNLFDLRYENVIRHADWIKQYGKVLGYISDQPTLLVADVELIRLIQTKEWPSFASRRRLVKGAFHGDARYVVGLNDHPDPQRWKEMRSLITTAFTSSKIRAAVPLITTGLDGLIDNISQRQQEPDFEIFDLFQRFTMDTIGQSAFGIHMGVQKDPDNPLFASARAVFEDTTLRIAELPLLLNLLFPELTLILYPIRRLQQLVGRLLGNSNAHTSEIDLCRKIIAQRKDNVTDPQNPYSRNDLLQLMIEANLTAEQMSSFTGSELTAAADAGDEVESVAKSQSSTKAGRVHHMNEFEVAANAALFFNAGFETTATTLAFLTHVLVNRQDIQDEVRREVQEFVASEEKLDYNVAHALPYLDSVLHETLRFFPPITLFITRQSTQELRFKDMKIPADTAIVISAVSVHHDPDYWQDPETFDPLRFFGANKVRASSPAFQAFGGGPRNCIGLRFALLQAKLTMARILLSYQLLPGPRTESFRELEMTYKPISQSPTNGIFVRVVPVPAD